MTNKIGVMQGRLVPKYQGRYQAFPIGMWKDEFKVAQACGLDLVEFILDFNDAEENPLLKLGGIDEIVSVCQNTDMSVKTICADYFMEAPLHSSDDKIAEESFKILKNSGKMIFASHPSKGKKIKLDPFDLIKGKKIFGSWGGEVRPDTDISKIWGLIKKADINLNDFIPKQYSLEEINIAINDLKLGKVFRPLIKNGALVQ